MVSRLVPGERETEGQRVKERRPTTDEEDSTVCL